MLKNIEKINPIDIDISIKHINKFKAILAGDFKIDESFSFEEISFEGINKNSIKENILKTRAERYPQNELK